MKDLFFCVIFLAIISTTYAADKEEIVAVTKGSSDKTFSFNDTNALALAYSVMKEQKFFPISVGSRTISAEEFSTLTQEQRKLVNRISHPNCCNRLLGYDYSMTDEWHIKRLEQEMPKNFMADHKILKIKEPGSLCCGKDKDHCTEAINCSLLGLIPFGMGGFTFLVGGLLSNCATPVLIAGGALCGTAVLCHAGVWSTAGIRSACCYDTEEYHFNAKTDNDEEKVNLSQDD